MNSVQSKFIKTVVLMLALTGNALANTDSLEKNSPFLPPGYKPPTQAPANTTPTKPAAKPSGKLEFRGAANIDGAWEFSIYDVKKRRGFWVSMNDPKAPYLVTSYNEKAQTITLGGADSQTLKLKEPTQRRVPSYRTPSTVTRQTPAPRSTPSTTPSSTTGTRPTPSTSSRSPRASGGTTPPGDIPPDIKALLDSLK